MTSDETHQSKDLFSKALIKEFSRLEVMMNVTLKIVLIALPIVIRMDRTYGRSIGQFVMDEIMGLPIDLFASPQQDSGGIDTGRITNYCNYAYGLEGRPRWLNELEYVEGEDNK